MNTTASPSLRVYIEIEDGRYVAQCVDYDISAEAGSVDAAIDAFIQLYFDYISIAAKFGVEPLQHIPPAPRCYFDLWRESIHREEVFTRVIPAMKERKGCVRRFRSVEFAVPVQAAA
ncbi:MAG: hypothetical protein AAGB26_02940 [Planctomycetota bacterium]